MLGRPTVRTDGFGTALARNSTTGYNARGGVSSVADGLSQTTNFGYDDAGRWATSTDPLNHTWTTGYDLAGRATTSTDPLSKITNFGYDDLGRQTSTTDANGNTTSRIFDAENRVVAEFDGLGNLTEHVYDVAGREILTIAPDGGITQRSYDDRGLLLTLTDPVGNTTRWEYDALGRVSKEIDPTGASKTFEYDSAGRMTRSTDRLGRVKEYAYDNANRLTSEVWKASLGGAVVETLSYTYYADNRLATAANAQGTYTITYDDLGRRKTIQDPHGITLTYGYSAADNVTSIADSRGGLVSNVFDAANRLTSTAQSGTGVTPLSAKFIYNNRDERTRLERYSDATLTTLIGSTDYTIDDGGRLTGQVHKNGAGTTLVTFTNAFDTDNKIASETRNSVTKNFTYDTTDQVLTDGTSTYSFDANGNRTMSGYSTGSANRIATDGTWSYTYNAEGNLTKMSKGASLETWTYGYNHNNQMIWAEQRATDGGTLQKRLDYAYDVFGNMLSRSLTTSSTTTVKFAYDVQGASIGIDGHINPLWAELDNSGNITTRFLVGEYEGEKLARTGSATHWLIHDRLGSLREVVDSSGALVNTISYDAFGNILSETSSALTGNYTYWGLFLERDMRMLKAENRDLNLWNGQWMQEDPWGIGAGDANFRRDVGNNTTNSTDLSGLEVDPWTFVAKYKVEVNGKTVEVPIPIDETKVKQLIKEKKYKAGDPIRQVKDAAGNVFTISYDGAFVGELTLGKQTTKIGHCISEGGRNLWVFKFDKKGKIDKITWYNFGPNKGNPAVGFVKVLQNVMNQKGFKDVTFEEQIKQFEMMVPIQGPYLEREPTGNQMPTAYKGFTPLDSVKFEYSAGQVKVFRLYMTKDGEYEWKEDKMTRP